MRTNRPSFNDFKIKALKNIEVKVEYDNLTYFFSI